MEAWRRCWREGVAPCLSTKALQALREALIKDDPRLMQRITVDPLPSILFNHEVRGACALAYAGWQEDCLKTANEVNHRFGILCALIDCRVNEISGCRWFLNWFDDTPREEMLRELLAEVELTLASREKETA